MKNTFLLLPLILVITGDIFAQDRNRENFNRVTLTYGVFTAPRIFNFSSEVLTNQNFDIIDEEFDTNISSSSGAIFFDYHIMLTRKINVGVAAGYEKIVKDVIINDELIGEVNDKYFSLMGEVEYNYISRDILQVFSGISGGLTFRNENATIDDNEETAKTSFVSYHFDIIGIRLGRSFGAFAKLGFGFKGLLNGGISYEF